MSKTTLERYQVWVYLTALGMGAVLGWRYPIRAQALEQAIWITLGVLLYATFCQVPLMQLRRAFRHRRFMGALLTANFGLVPLVVWGLANVLLSDPKLQFGVFLVLLVPCTDWFLTFTYLGKGNVQLAIASTPVLLVLQSLLLPMYLWLFTDGQVRGQIELTIFVHAFVGLILLPLGLALLTEHWGTSQSGGEGSHQSLGDRWLTFTSWLPVPLLALTLLLIAASQVQALSMQSLSMMGNVGVVFVSFLLINGYLSCWVGQLFQLETEANRTLAFSLGTRNSFVVLPFALALPDDWSIVVTIVVLQSLIELIGMIGYLWWVPQRLIKARSTPTLM